MKNLGKILLVAALLLGGCTQEISMGPAGETLSFVEGVERVWPAPPASPRIRYLGSVASAEDLGFKAPAFEQLFALMAGKEVLRLTRPYGLSVEGRLLAIADPGASAVHFMDLNGDFYKRVQEVGDTALLSPVGIVFGGDRFFVSDSALNKVFILDLGGELVRELDGLMRPTGLAFDEATQRLYVAETLAHRIGVFNLDGARLFDIESTGEKELPFNAPTHIAYRDGVLLVNDTMNFRVMAFDGDGQYLWSFGTHGTGSGHFSQLKGVDIDSRGRIYVVDAIFNRVQIFDKQGQFLLAFGNPGHGGGDLWLPAGIFLAGNRIFVADSRNMRVSVFEYVGEGGE